MAGARQVSCFLQSWDGAQRPPSRKEMVREASTGDGGTPHMSGGGGGGGACVSV